MVPPPKPLALSEETRSVSVYRCPRAAVTLSSVGSGPRSWGFCAWAGATVIPAAITVRGASTMVLVASRDSQERAQDVFGGLSEVVCGSSSGVVGVWVSSLSFLRSYERGSAWKTRAGVHPGVGVLPARLAHHYGREEGCAHLLNHQRWGSRSSKRVLRTSTQEGCAGERSTTSHPERMWAGPIGPAHMRSGLPFSWWPPRSTALDLTTGGGEDLTRVERAQPIGGEEHVRRRDLVRFAGPTHWGLSTETLAATFPQGGRDQWCPDRPRRHTVDTDVAIPQHLRQGEPQVHH